MAVATASPASSLIRTPPEPSNYRPDIDALRAVAITIVVAFHAGVPGFSGGFIGVDVFFVISGFVIMSALSREFTRAGRVDWPAFFARRVRRLVPAAALMIVVTVIAVMLLLNFWGEQQAVMKSAVAAATSTSNLYFAFSAPVDYFAESQPAVFLHTWSLSVEEQFYLAIPLAFLLAAVVARRARWTERRSLTAVLGVVVVLSFISALFMTAYAPTKGFFVPLGRGYELGIGALLAIVPLPNATYAIRRLAWLIGAGVLAAAVLLGIPAEGFPGAWALVPVLATAAMIWAHLTRSRVLLSRPVLGVGKVSYGWYLWHWPLLTIASTWFLRDLPVWCKVLLVLSALGFAVLSYHFVELRFRQPVDRNQRWPVVVAGVLTLAATSAIALSAGTAAEYQRQSAGADSVLNAASIKAVKDSGLPRQCIGTYEIRRHEGGAPCFVNGFDPSRTTVVVWGDSHGRMLMPAITVAAGRKVNLVEANLAGCPPYLAADLRPGQDFSAPTRAGFGLCQAHNFKVFDWIVAQRGEVRVLMTGRWPVYLGQHDLVAKFEPDAFEMQALHGQQIRGGTRHLVDLLTAENVRVDFVASEPALRRSAPDCISRTWRTFSCDVPRSDVDDFRRNSISWLRGIQSASLPGSRWIDLIDSVCDDQSCYAVRDGVITFRDDNHLSGLIVRTLPKYFMPTVS